MSQDEPHTAQLGHALKNLFRSMPIVGNRIGPFSKLLRRVPRNAMHTLHTVQYRIQYSEISRQNYLEGIKAAIDQNTGYAAGKLGGAEEAWMYYEILLSKEKRAGKIRRFEDKLAFTSVKNAGIFPGEPEFHLDFNKFYMNHVRNLDCLGICYYYPMELEILRHYSLKTKLIYYVVQEPDRSVPSNDENCYLPFFKDKKLLIVCPFAGLLKERATKEIFEHVWANTGKAWFYPAEVHAVEFPYGFSSETHKMYPTVIELFDEIISEIDKKDYDVALIAAGGLGIPIASHVKSRGKVGIDLGGHTQVLFGVIGQRWREREEWKQNYFNEYWIDMPVEYKPKETDVCDLGAYW